MGYIQDQIIQECQRIREHAHKWDLPEKHDPLRIVPFVSKRCIAYCGAGRCNCYPTVGHHFCIVFESHLQQSSRDFLSEMGWLQEQVEKSSQTPTLAECEQSAHLDETHLALKLSK